MTEISIPLCHASSPIVRYVPRRISYHAAHGGYDLLFSKMGLVPARSKPWAWVGAHLPGPIAWRLWALRPQGTNREGLTAEFGAIPSVRRSGGLTHFIYGEDTYFYTPLWRNARHRLIATYHYEPSRLLERASPAAVRSLDAVVIVGRNQREYFRNFFPVDRIHYVPHHVDTAFFCPAEVPPNEDEVLRVVFAGRSNRDFATLHTVIDLARRARARLQFDLVLPVAADHARFSDLHNTRCHRGLSDEELLSLYRGAHIGLMPVKDCTANNSLLEMMATGLPIVSTNIGAMPDYAGSDGADLSPPDDPEAMFQALEALAADASRRHQMGRANRARAQAEFSMAVSARRMEAVYAAVMSS